MTHANEDLLRRGYEAFASGDMETLSEIFHPDIAWHAAGDTPISGEFRGQQAVFENFAKIPQLTSAFSLDVHSVLADDEHAVALVKLHAERGGKTYDDDAAHAYHVSDGRVTEAWIMQFDQAAAEAFWAD